MTLGDPTVCDSRYRAMLNHWPTGKCRGQGGDTNCICERYVRSDGATSDGWPESGAKK